MSRKRRTFSAILLVMLILLLAGMGWMYHREEQQRVQWAQEMERASRPLLVQKSKLEQQLEDLQDSQAREQMGKATLQLLFSSPNQQLYEDIAPKMQEYGLTGTIALSLDDISQMEDMQDGTMNYEQLQELLAQGFSLCLACDGSWHGKEWRSAQEKLMSELEITEIATVYCAPGSYTAEMDPILADAGFTTLIHHGEEGLTLVSDVTEENQSELLWKIGACGWNSDNCRGYLNTALATGGNLVLTVGGSGESERYENEQFVAMLRTLSGYEQQESLLITDAVSSREYQQAVLHQKNQDESVQEQVTDLETQKKQLEEKLEVIYQDYDDKVTGKE